MAGRFAVRAETLRNVKKELERARKLHPTNQRTFELLRHYVDRLEQQLKDDATAIDIFATGVELITMAFRVVEEGDAKYRYASYLQNPGPLWQFRNEMSDAIKHYREIQRQETEEIAEGMREFKRDELDELLSLSLKKE